MYAKPGRYPDISPEILNPHKAQKAGISMRTFSPVAHKTSQYLEFEDQLKKVVGLVKQIQKEGK